MVFFSFSVRATGFRVKIRKPQWATTLVNDFILYCPIVPYIKLNRTVVKYTFCPGSNNLIRLKFVKKTKTKQNVLHT